MAIRVRLPTAYKKFTDDTTFLEFELKDAPTVREMTEKIFTRWPGLRSQMIERGELGRFVNIFVNGNDTRFIEGFETELSDGDEVQIVLAIAGG